MGELAIYIRVGSRYFGDEVRIAGPLRCRRIFDSRDGRIIEADAYEIDAPTSWIGGDPKLPWCAEPHELRKRRPPQDWVKLCNLTDVPREVAHG